MEIELTPAFRTAMPEGVFGALLVHGCANRARPVALDVHKRAVEARLRQRFTAESLEADPVARAYAGYFRRQGARYPVAHQARTVLQGRSIESPSALVEAMFTAEVESLVLTSGHDLNSLSGTLRVDLARDGEVYTKLSLKDQALRPGDMVVRDTDGVIACVLYGPDYRTRLRLETRDALFGAWCPVGLTGAIVQDHFDTLSRLLQTEWPEAEIEPPVVLAVRAAV
jgi:DNA/RNA-binding domain of Phe-tRNA-synthetase-like protein